jgi:hypothetical protein
MAEKDLRHFIDAADAVVTEHEGRWRELGG